MSLLSTYGLTPEEIERRSLEMVDGMLPPLEHLSLRERYVVQRIVRAEGDAGIADAVRFSPGAVDLGISALRSGCAVLADVRMVEVGTSRALLGRYGTSITTLIDSSEAAQRAKREGITRSAAAIRELAPHMSGAVVAVGNAPTALLALLDLVDAQEVSPALVIGMPVGFVACTEAKDELVRRSVPHVTVIGNRGGSSAAAATLNALLALAAEGV